MNKKFFIGVTLIIFAFSSNQVFAISVTGIAKALFGAVAHDSDDVARRSVSNAVHSSDDVARRSVSNAVHSSDDVARSAGRETQPSDVTLGDEVSAHVIKDSSKEYAKDYANEKFENAKQDAKNFFFGNANSKNYSSSELALVKMAKEHFVTDKNCNTNKVLSFYDNTIYYDNKEINIGALQKLKEDACNRFSGGAASLSMKDDYVRVKDFEGNSNLKILVYDVEFEFYSEKKQQTVYGTTRVALIATVDTKKIVGELHKKL